MRVGELFDYTEGQKQLTAQINDQLPELPLSAITPNKGLEFLQSILYFGVRENSVILAQSISLKSLQFQDYLNKLLWLTEVLSKDDYVSLNDQPPLRKGEKSKSTKGINFSQPIDLNPDLPKKIKEKRGLGIKSISIRPKGDIWDALKKLLPPEFKIPKKIKTNDVVLANALKLKITLEVPNVKKDDSTEFMDNFANQFSHVDEELDYVIHTRSGDITKDMIKLKHSVSVKENSEGLIRREEMWDKMYTWLESLITEDKVEFET
jgi:hypothetical protein